VIRQLSTKKGRDPAAIYDSDQQIATNRKNTSLLWVIEVDVVAPKMS